MPPVEKNGVAETETVPIHSQATLDNFCGLHRGSLKGSDNVTATTFEGLKSDGVYTFWGSFYKAIESDRTRRLVDDKVLEIEGAVAVKNVAGLPPRAHSL